MSFRVCAYATDCSSTAPSFAGLFTARGYNIDSLTVADITENHAVSRITIVTHGPPAQIDQSPARLAVGGLLVGIGTRFGNGCTSGHGVCGIARLSPRSLLATACFLAAGFVTVFIVRHVLGR